MGLLSAFPLCGHVNPGHLGYFQCAIRMINENFWLRSSFLGCLQLLDLREAGLGACEKLTTVFQTILLFPQLLQCKDFQWLCVRAST